MPIEDFIINVFCCVELLFGEIVNKNKLRRSGFPPSLADTEVITMEIIGRGRVLDNIFVERLWCSLKYEDIYLKRYGTVLELFKGLTEYFVFTI
jgi:hypothetical protein